MRNNEQAASKIHQAKVIKPANTWVETDAHTAHPKTLGRSIETLALDEPKAIVAKPPTASIRGE